MSALDVVLACVALAGPVGGLVSLLPWPPAKALGHVLAALGALDLGKVRAVVTTGQQVFRAPPGP
jgi:hypothetical protein